MFVERSKVKVEQIHIFLPALNQMTAAFFSFLLSLPATSLLQSGLSAAIKAVSSRGSEPLSLFQKGGEKRRKPGLKEESEFDDDRWTVHINSSH